MTKNTNTLSDSDFLRILSENLDTGVSVLNSDLIYEYISDAVYKRLNISKSDLKPGDSLSDCHELMLENGMFTPKIMQDQRLSSEEQRRRNDSDPSQAALVQLGDGSTHRFVRKTLDDGRIVSIATDVTDIVQTEKALDKALSLGNSGYWMLDLETKTYTLSSTLKHYFSKETQEQIHKIGIVAVVHPDDRHLFRDALKCLSRTNSIFEASCRTVSYKGNERWCQTTGELIRDPSGKPIRIEAFVKDITRDRRQAMELERAKDEAIAASHAKSEFLANMSHEIRTPMNGILGMAELLANSDINQRQRDFVNVINNSASALLTIINDILDFSKIEAGAFEIDPVPFDLKSSIGDVTAMLLSTAQQKGVELIINYPTDLPKHFVGDAGRVRQVITNLVGNSIKFTESGHITIDVKVKHTRGVAICAINVTDTGIGIAPDKLSHIFEKFTQADGSTTRVYGGTGLGLTISKHIIEMMGGKISVSSELGVGSTFGFRIPLPLDPDAVDEKFEVERISGKRALIIDDIAVNRTLLSEQLSAWGVSSDSAQDGVEALTKLKIAQDEGRPFDFLLLDYLMPAMNGQEFAQILHKNATIDTPPLIMLSSCDQPISSTHLTRIGIISYLVKPVRERRLFETIVRTLSNPVTIDALKTEDDEPDIEPGIAPPKKQEVLVAEDFALNQDVVRLMLADTPFAPVFVNDGKQAVELYTLDPSRFSVILMDVSMPVMDGFDATQAIRDFEAENFIRGAKIVALTGHALKNDREDCIRAGMDDYLTKPVKQIELIDKLEIYTGKALDLRRSA